jgi:hypothetical protein
MYSAHPVIHWLDYALTRTVFAVSRFAMTFLPVQLLLFWMFLWPTAIKLTLLHISQVSTGRPVWRLQSAGVQCCGLDYVLRDPQAVRQPLSYCVLLVCG